MKIPKFPIVFVRARDWQVFGDQHKLKEPFNIMPGEIAGFLIKEELDRIVIAREVFDSDPIEVRDVVAIPRENVISLITLKVGGNENRKKKT